MMFARIVKVGEESVQLDTNHPLADMTLDFEVTINGVRKASSEEIEHGHAHYGDDHGHE